LDGEPALMSITICCSELCEHECFTVAPVAFSKLAMTFLNMPSRAKIIAQTENYLHVEFTTPILRFVDDAEFLLVEEDKVIHARSAARVGYSEMDVNRKRIEDIRAAYESEN
jgi:uncharacterized protein (DUF1499 family)